MVRAAPELRPPAGNVRDEAERAVAPPPHEPLGSRREAANAYRATWHLCHAPVLVGWVAPLDLTA